MRIAPGTGRGAFRRGAPRCGGGIAGEEGQRNGRVDVGKDGRGAGPEALEQGAELIGERDALGDEGVAAAHERAQGAGVVGGRTQRGEAMAIRAQQIRQDEGIAGVTLGAGGRVARTRGFEGIGVDGHHLEPGIDERVDEQARGPFQGNPQVATAADAAQTPDKRGESLSGVWHGALPPDAAGLVDDADRVSPTRPVDADGESHCITSGDGETLRGERSGRSLTDWRSGLPGHVARHPVAGLGLSRFHSGERVSSWPSRGERSRLSPNGDRLAPLSALPPTRAEDFPSRERVGQ